MRRWGSVDPSAGVVKIEREKAGFVPTGSAIKEKAVMMGVDFARERLLGEVGGEEIERGVGGVAGVPLQTLTFLEEKKRMHALINLERQWR